MPLPRSSSLCETRERIDTAAVSAHNRRKPSETRANPLSTIKDLSAWLKPFSGPTATVTDLSPIVSGTPVLPHEISMKVQAVIPRLPELRQLVRNLEQRVATLEEQLNNEPARQARTKKTSPRTK